MHIEQHPADAGKPRRKNQPGYATPTTEVEHPELALTSPQCVGKGRGLSDVCCQITRSQKTEGPGLGQDSQDLFTGTGRMST